MVVMSRRTWRMVSFRKLSVLKQRIRLFHTRNLRCAQQFSDHMIDEETISEDEHFIKRRSHSQSVVEPYCNVPYDKQLESKMRFITEDVMTKWYNIAWNHVLNRRKYYPDPGMFDHDLEKLKVPVEEIIPSPLVDGYRNKSVYSLGPGVDGEKLKVGIAVWKQRERKIADPSPVKSNKKVHNETAKMHEEFLNNSAVPIRTPGDHPYLDDAWKNLLVRSNVDGELMIVAAIHHGQDQSSQDYQRVAKEELINFYVHGPGRNLNWKSLYLQKSSQMLLHDHSSTFELLHGEPYIHETLKNFKFAIAPNTFFQVNQGAAEVMYDTVKKITRLNEDTTLYDVCCGVGSLGIYLSPYVKNVVGVEMIEQSVQNAIKNAEYNGVSNAEFKQYKIKKNRARIEVDSSAHDIVAVVNPSRGGLHCDFIFAMRRQEQIKKVVYISCKPWGRPLYNFMQLTAGESDLVPGAPFKVTKIVPVDMFPHNKHFELLLYFER